MVTCRPLLDTWARLPSTGLVAVVPSGDGIGLPDPWSLSGVILLRLNGGVLMFVGGLDDGVGGGTSPIPESNGGYSSGGYSFGIGRLFGTRAARLNATGASDELSGAMYGDPLSSCLVF